MRFRAAPGAVAAAAILVAAAGCRRSPLGDGRDAAPDQAVEAPTRGDSRTGPLDAPLDIAGDVVADLGAADTAPTDGSPDLPDAPADLATTEAHADTSATDRTADLSGGDATDVRPQDPPCGPTGVYCAPFACDVARGICKTTCASNDDCFGGILCRNGTCGGITSTPCTVNSECNSGFCAHGVCCNTACSGICTSCALAGSVGVCRPVPSGAPDPLARCPGSLCDGAGSCMLPTCTADEQCAVRRWCMDGRCLPCVATCTSDAACVGGAICLRRNECSYCANASDAGP